MADIDSEKERRLVADLLEGDESAFCELYALYKDRLMWFSLKFLKSRDMAEDVFQDAFASIVRIGVQLVPFADCSMTIVVTPMLVMVLSAPVVVLIAIEFVPLLAIFTSERRM